MAARKPRKSAAPAVPGEPAEPAAPAEQEVDMVRAIRLIQQLSSIVNNTVKRYWLSPDDRTGALAECFATLEHLVSACPQVTVRTFEGAFTINGRTMEYSDGLTRSFLDHLEDMDVDNFAFLAGVTLDEVSKFCEVVSATPAELKQVGDFATVLERFHVEHIRSKRLIYRAVSEHDVVVRKDELRQGAGAGPQGPLAGDILAFIKGGMSPGDASFSQAARDVASDPERMAQLILQAAELRENPAGTAEGETLGDFVVACLRRTYEGIRQDPAFNTPRGRKRAARNLLLLEEEIVRRMRELSQPEWTEQDLDAITSAAEDITDEIKIDSVAEEYTAAREAAAEAERRLLDMIRSTGTAPDGKNPVLERLAQHGLSASNWQELVVKSGGTGGSARPEWASGPLGGSPGILEAISHLDSLLDSMEKQFDHLSKAEAGHEADRMLSVLEDVSTQIRQLTTQTGLAIQSLIQDVQHDAKTAQVIEATLRKAGHALTMTRQDAYVAIAKILGEIAEPIELVRTSLDMMQSRTFADQPEVRKNVIRLACENAALVKTLVEHLQQISHSSATPSPPGPPAR